MNQLAAEMVFFSVLIVALIVWGVALRMASRAGRQVTGVADDQIDVWNPPTGELLNDFSGYWEVEGSEKIECGNPEEAIQFLARKISEGCGNAQQAHQYRIEKTDPRKLNVMATGAPALNRGAVANFDEAEFEVRSVGVDRVEVDYRASFGRLAKKARKISLAIIVGLGMPLLLIVFGLIWFLVVQHSNDAVRWQVFQSLQIAHVLWPPFLILAIYRGAIKNARNSIPNMIRSIEFQ